MKITSDYAGLVDIGWAYKFEGPVSTSEGIEISLGGKWLLVTGSIESGGRPLRLGEAMSNYDRCAICDGLVACDSKGSVGENAMERHISSERHRAALARADLEG